MTLPLLSLRSLAQREISLAEQAALAWESRDKPGQTEEAVRLWTLAAQKEPQQAEHWIHLAQAMGRALRHAKTPKEKRRWADLARAAAENAVRVAPQNADAHTALGEALGQWAQARKSVRSLKAVKSAVASLHRAIEINPKHAYAHMLLAEFYRQSPSVLSIGNKAKALEHARLSVQHGPAYAINHLVLARALLDNAQKEEAILELRKTLALSPPADAVPETLADQATAKSMLQVLEPNPQSSTCEQTSNNVCAEAP